MPNSYTGIFQQLASAFNQASLAKVGKNVLINMVTRDFSPEIAQPFSVINTNPLVSSGTATNLTPGNAVSLSDITMNAGAVTLNTFPTYAVALQSQDLALTYATSFIDKVKDEVVKKIGNSINGSIAALITAANFTTHGSNTVGADTISDANMATAWGKLAAADIPIGDFGNAFLIVHPAVYANLLQTNSWTQNAYIGDISSEIRRTALLGNQWGVFCDWDPDVPLPAAGTYACLLFHRNAIALVARALAPPLDTGVPTMYVNYKGIPIRMTIAWNNLARRDELVVDAMFGVSVVREDHGCFMVTT
jgi:hypothetical protein